jgi:hypothetical protein
MGYNVLKLIVVEYSVCFQCLDFINNTLISILNAKSLYTFTFYLSIIAEGNCIFKAVDINCKIPLQKALTI